MIQVSPKRVRLLALTICLTALVLAVCPAHAEAGRQLNFKKLVDQSDQIFIAKCTERRTAYEDGQIRTHYKLKPSEVWKGNLQLSSDGQVDMAETGGRLTGPVPIGQAVPGMADFARDEEVLLFTANPKPGASHLSKAGANPANASPHIVGSWQGRFSVLTHPRTGNKMIARFNLSTVPGAAVNSGLVNSVINQHKRAALLKGDAPTTTPLSPAERSKLEVEVLKESTHMGEQIDRAVAQSRAQHQALLRGNPAAADEIYQYEQLDAVKIRVLRQLKRGNK